MGTLDDFRKTFGEDALKPRTGPAYVNWHGLCVCGHHDGYHSPSIGGSFHLTRTEKKLPDGRLFVASQVFHGCRGAMVNRGEETVTEERDADAPEPFLTERFLATCPCEKYTEVARIDRPNRYFNQRVLIDREDPSRHPFATGIRAFSTHLSKRKAATADPAWAEEELDRRFVWTHRHCAISKCTATDGVWPVFINDTTSELRCAKHRP